MKIYKAALVRYIPGSVISKMSIDICYGYTIWKKDVVLAIKEGEEQVEHFIRLKEEGVCDKVNRVIEEVEDDKRLLKFMQDNDVEVFFTDEEGEE